MALKSKSLRSKENFSGVKVGSAIAKHQALTRQWKFYVCVDIESEASSIVVQLKRNP